MPDRLVRDLRFALRSLTRDPGFSMAAIATLALGVGAITTLAAVVAGVLLSPLPYWAPERLVAVLHGPTVNGPVSPADYEDLRREARSFSAMGAAQAWGANLAAGGRTERIPALQVTGSLFEVLGVAAAAGRTISNADVDTDARVIVIAHALWVRRFGADPAIVGRAVVINGESYRVIGVMPAPFQFAPFWQTRAEAWVPLSLAARRADRDGRSLRVFARLADGASLDQARAELSAINARLAAEWPETNTGLTTSAVPLTDKAVGAVRPLVLAIFGLAAGLLLAAVVNLAMLVMTRITSRQSEWAIRAALGAGRRRLVVSAAVEGLLVACAGAAGGVACAIAGTQLLVATLPADSLPPHAVVAVSTPVLLFAAAVAALAALCASVGPVWGLIRRDSVSLLRPTRSSTPGKAATQTRRGMVATEVALAFALAAAAVLFGRTVGHLQSVPLGFEPHRLFALSVSLDGAAATSADARTTFFASLASRVATMPGVASVSAINHLPLAGDRWFLGYAVDGRPAAAPGREDRAVYRVVLPGYFSTMGQRLAAGRDFGDADRAGAVPVAIVNRRLAERQWPGQSAIGQRLRFEGSALTIVGVVADAAQQTLLDPIEDELYLPLAQRPFVSATRSPMTLVVRARADTPILPAVTAAIWSIDRRAAVYEGMTMDDVLADEIWRQRLGAHVGGLFAVVALALAALGIGGVVRYTVTMRRREFGVRLALGATRRHVVTLALVEAAIPLVIGLTFGIGVFAATARLLATVLVGIAPGDPVAIGSTAAALIAIGLIAAWRPAARAASIDPAEALRI